MSHIETRYHKVVGLHPVQNWSRKKYGGPRSGPKLSHIGTKTVALITEIKTQEYHVNLYLFFNIFDKHCPTLGSVRTIIIFVVFSKTES